MRASINVPVVLLLTMVFAGCTGSSGASGNSASPSAPDAAAPPSFSDETGAIHGVVTDDAVAPLEGVQVGIPALTLATMTDATGAYTLNGVAPGSHTVFFGKLGYEQVGKKVEVVAGTVTEANAVLAGVVVDVPFPELISQAGYIQCSVRAYPGAPYPGGVLLGPGWYSGVNVCGVFCAVQCLPIFSPDKFAHDWHLKSNNTREVVLEMAWQSTQTAGGQMSVVLEAPGHVNDATPVYTVASGKSPLFGYANETHMAEVGKADDIDCIESKCSFGTRVFAEASLTGLTWPTDRPNVPGAGPPPKQLVDAGLILDQHFTEYLTAFHGMIKPDGYSALKDG